MKKLIFTGLICLSAMFGNAQLETQEQLVAFQKYSSDMDIHVDDAFKKKDYTAAADTLKLWLDRYQHLSSQFQLDVKQYSVNVYYNLSCAYSRLNKKPEAIAAFENSISFGYRDYDHLLVDNDLDNIRNEQQFKNDVTKLHENYDYGYVLKKSGPYNNKHLELPRFTYQPATDPSLVALKNKFNLDSVSGNGDEISRIKRLLYWVHNQVKHDGNSDNPRSKNAIDLIEICHKENRGVNCRMMSTILRDAYQSEGFQTRIVTCMPKDTSDSDCHVITVVWSKTLNKWVWMDPTFNAYVTDGKGNLLNIEEVRQRLINGDALVLNEDANWNNKVKQTKENYLGYYMSKNLYWLQCSAKNEWNLETYSKDKAPIDYLNLYPGTYNTIHRGKKIDKGSVQYATNNPDDFWKKPADAMQ